MCEYRPVEEAALEDPIQLTRKKSSRPLGSPVKELSSSLIPSREQVLVRRLKEQQIDEMMTKT